VGSVEEINLISSNQNKLLVCVNIKEDIIIPKNSTLRISNQDLIGTKSIKLIFGNDLVPAVNKDTLLSSVEGSLQEEVNAQILPFKRKAEELIVSIDSVMMIITAVLNEDVRDNLSSSINSLDKTFATMLSTMTKVDDIVEYNNQRISNIIENLESILSNIEGNNKEVENILNNLSIISDSIAGSNITTAINNFSLIFEQIDQKKGNLGLFINDDQMYKNLEKSTRELANLIKDIKEHPKRYLNFSLIRRNTSSKKD